MRARRWRVNGVRLVVYGIVFIALLWLVLTLLGHVVFIVPRKGTPTGGALSFAPAAETAPLVQDFEPGSEVKNLVILLGDGMGFSHLAAARAVLVGPNGRLEIERMPVTGWLATHSASQMYTDSAAGATALVTGVKTEPGRLAVSPTGAPLRTLAEAARARGKAVGLVTDSYLWDATPAALVTHLESRRDYPAVAAAMAASGAEFLVGEVHPKHGGDRPGGPMLADFKTRGYTVARGLRELAAASLPAVGLFEFGAVADPDRPPELVDLASLALEKLAADGAGFVLLIETEEVDTGSHDGDFARAARGVGALDAVAAKVLEFARRDRRTLVLVTADHETGGLTVLLGREGEPLRVRWATGAHTSEPVPLLAYGPGAETLAGVRDNADVAPVVARLLGLDLGN